LGEGFVNGRKFWLGQGATDNTLGIDDRVIKPIAEGCQLVSDFTATGFSSIPTLLASKRTRNGNNGGWLRRCSVSKTGVALINEEDMANDYERAHVVEPYSYFLFDKPPANEICELFPSPAQTWVGNTSPSLSMSNTSKISGTPVSNGRR
jgi:MSHA biogenesis protein MshQ